jgi:hypothetical protein
MRTQFSEVQVQYIAAAGVFQLVSAGSDFLGAGAENNGV